MPHKSSMAAHAVAETTNCLIGGVPPSCAEYCPEACDTNSYAGFALITPICTSRPVKS